MTKKVTSLSDLANLTLGRNSAVAAAAPLADDRNCGDIAAATRQKIKILLPPTLLQMASGLFQEVDATIVDAIHDAYALGQQQAKAEAAMLHDAMVSTHEKRAEFVVPAAVAGIMEQCGMTDLSLNFKELATVFERCKITVEVPDDLNVRYTLTHLADKVQQP